VSDDETIDIASVMSSNRSFASSNRDYYFENGRRYQAYRSAEHALPNDEREQDRLTLVHFLFKELVDDMLYRAPIIPAKTHRILDFGTGTGIWAVEMAEDFPHMTVIGTDLSPIQPTWMPINCEFHIDDIENTWAYGPEEAFDYIHGRSMAGSIRDWENLLKQIQAHLNPGGWVELQEFEIRVRCDDGTLEQAKIIKDWLQKVHEASMQFGKQMNVVETLRQKMLDANFVNVTDELIKVRMFNFSI
jgi:SAM-dependent methyltransferase